MSKQKAKPQETFLGRLELWRRLFPVQDSQAQRPDGLLARWKFKITEDLPRGWANEGDSENLSYAYQLFLMREDTRGLGKVYNYLYDELTVLDRKTSGQLSFSSLLAVIFVLLHNQQQPDSVARWFTTLGLAWELIAASLVLFAIWVRWIKPLKPLMAMDRAKLFPDVRKLAADQLAAEGLAPTDARYEDHLKARCEQVTAEMRTSNTFEEDLKGAVEALMRTRNYRTVLFRISFSMSLLGAAYAVVLVAVMNVFSTTDPDSVQGVIGG